MNKNMIKESDGLYVENNSDENTIKIARVIRNSLKKDGYNNIEVIDNKIRISIN